MANHDDQILAAARALADAEQTSTPCPPVRDLVDEPTIDAGYEVQRLTTTLTPRGDERVVGRKIGLTSRAVQAQIGVDQPDFGVLFAGMAFGDADPIPAQQLLQPRAEAEVAFVLGRDLTELPVTTTDVLRATEFVVAAIEVVDSRIRDWDIGIFDTVADNASSGVFVLGNSPRRLHDLPDLAQTRMSLTAAGREVSTGSGADCLGHPVNAVTWLANTVGTRGVPLREGEVVLSGALGPLAAFERGDELVATVEGLGSVRTVIG